MTAVKPSRSLHRDLVRAFWIHGGLLVVIFAGIVMAGSIRQQDTTLKRQLDLELEDYLATHGAALAQGASPPPVISRFTRAHLGTDSLPESIRDKVALLPEGIYDVDKGFFQGEDYFVAIHSLPGREQRLYLVYDERKLDEWLEFGPPSLLVFLIGGTAVTLLGWAAAARLSRRVLEPVADLERTVSDHPEPRQLANALAARQAPPDLAALSSTLERSMHRLDAFVARERKFTRDASHELRTPVTVIRGATELLQQNPNREQTVRLVGRVRRAVDQMEDLIETFLWMARENIPDDTSWSTDLGTVARDVVDTHRPLLAGRDVELELEVKSTTPVAAPRQAVSVVISNLFKNALDSTAQGRVRIEASGSRVRVVDTGAGLAAATSHPADRAHGFGMTIVQELCGRFGWRATLSADEAGGAVATVDFEPQL